LETVPGGWETPSRSHLALASPPGAPRGPPPARTSPGACSQLWGGRTRAESVQGRWARGRMLLGSQHPPSPWQPPHPSWDAARPDDEVISGGERGRQAGSGDPPGPGRHPNLPATITRCAWKAGAARAGPPSPNPRAGAGGSAHQHSSEHQNPGQSRPHPSSQLPDRGWARGWEQGGPWRAETPPNRGHGWTPGAEKQKAGRQLPNTAGASLHPPAPTAPRAPGSEPQIIAPTRLTLIRTSRSR